MRRSAVALALVGLFFAGCGGDDGASVPPPGREPAPKAPNLTADNVSFAAAQVETGLDVWLNRRLRNTSADEDVSRPFNVNYYLSQDATLDTGADDLVGTESILGLEAETDDEGQVQLNTAAILTAGVTYYCFVVVDADEDVDELSETDNTVRSNLLDVVAAAAGDPDLVGAIDTDTPSTIFAGRGIGIDVTSENVGGDLCGGTSSGQLYLSDDEIPDAGEEVGAAETTSDLGPGQAEEYTVGFTVPAGTGSKYLIWVVDDAGAVAEGDEGNNIATMAVTVTDEFPDLEARGVVSEPPLVAAGVLPYPIVRGGDQITITSTFKNVSATVDVPVDFDVTFLMSDDETIGAGGDTPIVTASFTGPLAADATGTVSIQEEVFDLPLGMPPMLIYAGSIVDSGDVVGETDETAASNVDQDSQGEIISAYVFSRGFGPGGYDLWVVDADIVVGTGPDVVAGAQFTCDAMVASAADIPPDFWVGVYFSDNDDITALDTLVGSKIVTADDLLFGRIGMVTVTCTAPTVEGDYYWGVIVNQVNDPTDWNNTFVPGPPWQVAVVGGPGTVDIVQDGLGDSFGAMGIELDEPFLLGYDANVTGNSDTGPFTIKFYASTDGVIDGGANDALIATLNHPGLPAGYQGPDMGPFGVTTVQATLTTAAAASVGIIPVLTPVYVGYILDSEDAVAEVSELNNTYVTPTPLPLPVMPAGFGFAELMVIAYLDMTAMGSGDLPFDPPPYYVRAGATGVKWPMLAVLNMGTHGVTNVPVDFYLSTDQVVDLASGDIYLGTVSRSIAAGAFDILTGVGSLSFEGVNARDYWLYAYIDPPSVAEPSGSVTEFVEDNNDSATLDLGGGMVLGCWIPVTVFDGGAESKPDLVPAFTVDTDQNPGEELIGTIANSLEVVAPSSVATVWTSDNAAADVTGDSLMDMIDVTALLPGEVGPIMTGPSGGNGAVVDWSFFLADLNAGLLTYGDAYYVKLAADSADEIDEAVEGNNIAVIKVQCLVYEDLDSGWAAASGAGWTRDAGWVESTFGSDPCMTVDGASVRDDSLTTPSFDCSDLATVTLEFAHYLDYNAAETVVVEINVDGAGWTAVPGGTYSASTGTMVGAQLDISSAAGGSAVRVRWRYTRSAGAGSWWVDDVKIYGLGAP